MQAKLVVTDRGISREVTGPEVDNFARGMFTWHPAAAVGAGTATLVPVHQKRPYTRRKGTHHKWTAEEDSMLLSITKPKWGQLAKLARKWRVNATAVHSRKWALKHPQTQG